MKTVTHLLGCCNSTHPAWELIRLKQNAIVEKTSIGGRKFLL